MGARLFKNWWLVLVKGLAFLFLPFFSESLSIAGFHYISTVCIFIVIFSVASSLVYSLPPRYSIWHFEAVFDFVLLIMSFLVSFIGFGFFLTFMFIGYATLFIFLGKTVFEIKQFLSFTTNTFYLIGFVLLVVSMFSTLCSPEEILTSPNSLQSNLASIYQALFPNYSILFLNVIGISFVYIAIRLKIITSTQQNLLPR